MSSLDDTPSTRAAAAFQSRSDAVIETLPSGVVVVATDGAVVLANAEARRILDLDWDDPSARYVTPLGTETLDEGGSPRPAEESPASRCLASGEPQPPVTIGIRRSDGAIGWAVLKATPLRADAGELLGAVVTCVDLSALVLVRRVAHDFGNLLVGIMGRAELAERSLAQSSPARPHLEDVRAAAERAGALTDRLRVLAGRQVPLVLGGPAEGVESPPPVASTHGLVLVVDDEKHMRFIATVVLEEEGYEVLTACDGEEALRLFDERADDVRAVVLDLVLPGMGGDEVLAALRARRPNVPVILTSGFGAELAPRRVPDEALAGFLKKPFRLEELVAAVRRACAAE